jgi:hypothetical protein
MAATSSGGLGPKRVSMPLGTTDPRLVHTRDFDQPAFSKFGNCDDVGRASYQARRHPVVLRSKTGIEPFRMIDHRNVMHRRHLAR